MSDDLASVTNSGTVKAHLHQDVATSVAEAQSSRTNDISASTQMVLLDPRHVQSVAHGISADLSNALDQFWQTQLAEARTASDFKNHLLPLARIKKIMKSDEDVRMISAEAPLLFSKACEMFILELTHRAWAETEESKRRTLQRSDISAAIQKTDIFDFLIDIVPRSTPTKDEPKPLPRSVDQTPIQYYGVPNVGMPPGAYPVPMQMNPSMGAVTSAPLIYAAAPQQMYGSPGYPGTVPYPPGMVNTQYVQMPQLVYGTPNYPMHYNTNGATSQDQNPPQS